MKLANLIANGTISVADLANASELIERAKLVTDGLKACTQTLLFPLGTEELHCFSYTDRAGEYSSWGTVSRDGTFTCWCNWGGNHEIGRVNLNKPAEVFVAFDNYEFASDLKRFLKEQIQKAIGFCPLRRAVFLCAFNLYSGRIRYKNETTNFYMPYECRSLQVL